MVACEGDVGGLITMQIMFELTGNAPVQMEWGQFDSKHNALFLLGHGSPVRKWRRPRSKSRLRVRLRNGGLRATVSVGK